MKSPSLEIKFLRACVGVIHFFIAAQMIHSLIVGLHSLSFCCNSIYETETICDTLKVKFEGMRCKEYYSNQT